MCLYILTYTLLGLDCARRPCQVDARVRCPTVIQHLFGKGDTHDLAVYYIIQTIYLCIVYNILIGHGRRSV